MKTFEQIREIYDAAVMDAWEYGDSHYELGVSEITLGEIHDAARCLECMDFCESLTDEDESKLSESDLDALVEMYDECNAELLKIYTKWYRRNLTWF